MLQSTSVMARNGSKEPSHVSTTTRPTLGLFFIALGFLLSLVSFPAWPTRVLPFQHVINTMVGIMLGDSCSVLALMY